MVLCCTILFCHVALDIDHCRHNAVLYLHAVYGPQSNHSKQGDMFRSLSHRRPISNSGIFYTEAGETKEIRVCRNHDQAMLDGQRRQMRVRHELVADVGNVQE